MSHSFGLFKWDGLNRFGEYKKGQILALSLLDAQLKLRKNDIITRKIVKINCFLKKQISKVEIAFLARQIATTVVTGIPFMQALELITNNQSNPIMIKLLLTIKKDLQAGLMFSESLQKHPKLFNQLFCSLVAVGEESGTLNLMLERIAVYLENKEKTKQKIKKVLTYPVILIILLGIVTACLLIFVVPEFVSLYKSFEQELPFSTLLVISIANYVKSYYGFAAIVLVVIFFFGSYLYKINQGFICFVDKILLTLPFIGKISQNIFLARFSHVLFVTLKAGLPMLDSLKLALNTVGNKTYVKAIDFIICKVSQGETLQMAMQNTQIFPEFIINMISLGEESGSVSEMLKLVADYYDRTTDQTICAFSDLIEPIVMTILGFVIGGLVLAMYFPILQLGSLV